MKTYENNKKWFLIFVILMIFTFTGCAKSDKNEGPQSGTGTEGEPSGKQVSMDFVWFTDGIEDEVMKSIVADYEQDNPNIKINLVEVAYKDLETRLRTRITGGKAPALTRITNTGPFVNQALDLADYVGNAEDFSGQFIESIKPYYVIDGKLIAAPMDVTANGLIYNKTLFDKAEVDVPQSADEVWTWDEFSQAILQVKEKGGARYGLVWDVTPHRWSTLLYEFGGSIFTEDLKGAAINNEAGVDALRYFVDMHKNGVMPESVWLGGENPNNLFRSGTAAAHLSGNWMMSNYRDIDNFEWGVAYLPKQQTRSSVPGGKYVMAFQNTGVEDEAAHFIQYLTSREVNANYCSNSLFISPRLDNAELEYEFGTESFRVFANELEHTPPAAGRDWSHQEVVPKIITDLENNIMSTISGNMDPQQALDAIAKIIESQS